MMQHNKLPADPTALILSIASVAMIVIGCCCGLFYPVALTLGIIGLVQAQKSLKIYEASPENYSMQSRSNMSTAKILAIIGICISGIAGLVSVIYFAIVGSVVSTKFWEEFEKAKNKEENKAVIDSLMDEQQKMLDSIAVDTTFHYTDSITE